MKKQLLSIAILLFLTTQAIAQTSVYHPFPDSNAVWQVNYGGLESICELYQNNFDGDTTVNAIHYHKIHKQGFELGHDFYSYCDNSVLYLINEYFCAIRYDSSQKKVFMLPMDSLNEKIIYDFTLKVGDYFHSYLAQYAAYNFNNDSVLVTSIDSALVGNGYRKRWNFAGSINSVIEGIGAISGLVGPMGFFEQSGQLICFSQNGVALYPDTSTTCVLPSSLIEINNTNEEVILYPNPSSTQVIIHSSFFHANETLRVSVMNVLGEIVQEEKLKWINNISMNINNLSAGIYFLQMKSESGSLVKKFVKE